MRGETLREVLRAERPRLLDDVFTQNLPAALKQRDQSGLAEQGLEPLGNGADGVVLRHGIIQDVGRDAAVLQLLG